MNDKARENKEALSQLRNLLLGSEIEEIEELKQKIENPQVFSENISKVLPQAMQKSSEHGEELSEAMVPTVEEIVRLSIKKDINKFATALFPVIGPAIRKSISETMRLMLQSLNQVLEHAFSWQGLKWRIESLRTGIPFAQVVLLNSFTFRVDQVFLIHRESGILLNSVEQDDALSLHADMVSSMLTAITDFVVDSFQTANKQALDSIQVGDFSILIEQGPGIILAVACRGEVSKELRKTMVQIVEEIQAEFSQQLEDFKGDTAIFKPSRTQLLSCLSQTQQEPTSRKITLITKLIGIVFLILLSFWIFNKIYLSKQQHDYVNLLEQEPGYIVTQANYGSNLLTVKGLRDPLARDPHKFVALTTLDPKEINLKFKPFQSYNKVFVEKRIVRILQPTSNIKINFNQGLLRISGIASKEKINSMRLISLLITGVTQVDMKALSSDIDLSVLKPPSNIRMKLNIDEGHLIIEGEAYNDWIKGIEQRSLSIRGIHSIDISGIKPLFDTSVFNPPATISLKLINEILHIEGEANNQWLNNVMTSIEKYPQIKSLDLSLFKNSDEKKLNSLLDWVQQQTIFFNSALSFSLEKKKKIDELVKIVLQAVKLSRLLSIDFFIIIRGYSDSIGSYQDNIFLSFERAEFVAQYLLDSGINPRYIQIKGIEQPVKIEKSSEQRAFNRRVTFTVNKNNTGINRYVE